MNANYKHIRFEEIHGFTVCQSKHGGAVPSLNGLVGQGGAK